MSPEVLGPQICHKSSWSPPALSKRAVQFPGMLCTWCRGGKHMHAGGVQNASSGREGRCQNTTNYSKLYRKTQDHASEVQHNQWINIHFLNEKVFFKWLTYSWVWVKLIVFIQQELAQLRECQFLLRTENRAAVNSYFSWTDTVAHWHLLLSQMRPEESVTQTNLCYYCACLSSQLGVTSK